MNLVEMHDGVPMVSSLQVAEHFGKRHDSVLRSIQTLGAPEEFTAHNFVGSEYDGRNGRNPMYWMTKDGFSLLVMGFTGPEAMRWKVAYIEAFNRMADVALEADRRVYIAPDNKADMLKLMDAYLSAQEQAIADERQRSQLLIADHTGLVNRTRAAERHTNEMLEKVRSLAAHAYRVRKELEEGFEQDDLLAGVDAEKVSKIKQQR